MRHASEDCSSSSDDNHNKESYSQDEGEGLLSSSGNLKLVPRARSNRIGNIVLVLNVVLLAANALGWILLAAKNPNPWAWRGSKSGVLYSQPQILSPSPAQEAVQHELHRFSGIGDNESPYNAPASDETDKLWDELIDNGKWFAIDPDTFLAANGNPATGLRIPNDPAGRFFGMLQVNHQLHCVDILRRSAWFNIDFYRHKAHFRNKSDHEIILHTGHCLEILRQTIQCHGDTALLTYNWVHGHDWPQSAWRSLHSCQNWEALGEWRRENDISELITHLERPAWVLDPKAEAPGRRGAAEAVDPIVCSKRDLDCRTGADVVTDKDGVEVPEA